MGELDVIAFFKINKFIPKPTEVLKKYEFLDQWYGNMEKIIEPLLAKIKKDFQTVNKKSQQVVEEKKKDKILNKNPEQKPKEESAKKNTEAKKKKTQVDEQYLKLVNGLKLTRLNKGKEVLPEKNQKNILITSALPYVNNIPHLGTIIGCVLSADVYARFCRQMGYNTIYICGTDEYGTATEMKARQMNMTPQEICQKYFTIQKQVYDWFDIDFDMFGRTSTDNHTKIAQDIFLDLYNNKLIEKSVMQQSYCEKCQTFLADRYVKGICPYCQYQECKGDQCEKCSKLLSPEQLIQPQCELCKSTPKIKDTQHCFLNLPKISEQLQSWIDISSQQGQWTENSQAITKSWMSQGLQPRCITRDLKWGTAVPLEGWEKKVMYVWFDAPIGYISITSNYTKNWEQWWKNPDEVKLYQFMAKDNVPFHSVIFPATLLGTGKKWTLVNHLNSTEYLNYEDIKFSKSKGTGVFGDDVQKTNISADVWRYYLLSTRPEKSDYAFMWSEFGAKNNNELLANPGNLINRVLKWVYSNYNQKLPEFSQQQLGEKDIEFLKSQQAIFIEFIDSLDKVKIKRSLELVMQISSNGNIYLQTEEPWNKEIIASGRANVIYGIMVNFIRFLSALFEPFMPSLSAKINYFLGIEQRQEKDERIFKLLKETNDFIGEILKLVPSTTKLREPLPLFNQRMDIFKYIYSIFQ